MDLDGLQRSIQYKYKYYCEMCKKQCKDANGFKCHCNTEHHKQMMKLLAENQSYYINKFSEEFESGFLSLLRSKYLNVPVAANKVYSQFGHDRYNVRLNSTRWPTLTSFLEHLAAAGKCQLNKTEKGWMLLCGTGRKEVVKGEDKEMVRQRESKREGKRLQKLIERADRLTQAAEIVSTPLVRKENEVISIEMSATNPGKNPNPENPPAPKDVPAKPELDEKEKEFEQYIKKKERETEREQGKRGVKRRSEREYWEGELSKFIEEKKKRQEENEPPSKSEDVPWIAEGIVVKVVDEAIAKGKYYKKKGLILKIHNEYVAEVKMLEGGDVIKIDQAYLETVVPGIGAQVLLLVGDYRGERGTMRGLFIDEAKARIEVQHGKVLKVPYEGFSKLP